MFFNIVLAPAIAMNSPPLILGTVKIIKNNLFCLVNKIILLYLILF